MVWVRIDEDFAQHPKLVSAGPNAMALQVAALCYANRNLTDGFLPRAAVHGLIPSDVDSDAAETTKRLIAHGIWEEVEGGYAIHDYLDYQPSREQVRRQRTKRSRAGRRGGLASGEARAQARARALASPTVGDSLEKRSPKRSVGDRTPYPKELSKESSEGRKPSGKVSPPLADAEARGRARARVSGFTAEELRHELEAHYRGDQRAVSAGLEAFERARGET
jgi:hypothetical protein